jgi:Collagen triple helix repeat (20 copies)
MNKKIILLSSMLFGFLTYGQAPQKMSYQSVVRDNTNLLVTNSTVGVRMSILQGSASGTVVYEETHSISTNSNGLASLAIGGGTVVSGSMSGINWGAGPFFVKTETDPAGGTNYTIVGTSELLSTPYALYAANSPAGPQGPAGTPGLPGTNGLNGAVGPQGTTGAQGLQGIAGTNGVDGMNGTNGADGATGPAGPQGIAGADGANGIDGMNGTNGADGATGPAGPQGITGANGIDGSNGTNGADGATGPTGPQGIAGANGADGMNGTNGADGATGPAGPQGTAGANGSNGATGPAGPQGIAGANGSNGATGPAGPQGTAGANGADGAPGVAGPTGPAGPAITLAGTSNYVTKFATASTVGNSTIQDNGTSISAGLTTPSVIYQFYVYRQQLTVNGDGQSSLMGYRTRNSQNDGISYAQISANDATRGYNFWGDVYTFGVGGWNYNDYSRCGGTFGGDVNGLAWGSLGYRSSGLLNYGVYGSAAYASGGGFAVNNLDAGIGGGFHGMIGTMTKGNVIGQFNKGGLFASYNIGDVYTSGKNVELVSNGTEMTPAYAVTSTEAVIYKKGRAQMVNGTATIAFDSNYSKLLGERPVVTITPMGQCNGVYIESVTKNGFTIKELNAGNSSVEISWIAVGDRVDAKSTEVPSFIKDKSFDQNIDKVLFNDGDKTHSGEGIWWDGSTLQMNKNYPRELNPTREDKTRMLEAEKAGKK